jgi:hypothetical protein
MRQLIIIREGIIITGAIGFPTEVTGIRIAVATTIGGDDGIGFARGWGKTISAADKRR